MWQQHRTYTYRTTPQLHERDEGMGVLIENLMSTESIFRISSKHITDQILSTIRDTWPGFRFKIKFASQNLSEDSSFSF